MFLPVLPTTPFMLLALYLWAHSSPRFHRWLYHHRIFGPPLQQWDKYRVIPKKAKIAAVTMMSLSFVYVALFVVVPKWLILLIALLMGYAIWFILSKPSSANTTAP